MNRLLNEYTAEVKWIWQWPLVAAVPLHSSLEDKAYVSIGRSFPIGYEPTENKSQIGDACAEHVFLAATPLMVIDGLKFSSHLLPRWRPAVTSRSKSSPGVHRVPAAKAPPQCL